MSFTGDEEGPSHIVLGDLDPLEDEQPGLISISTLVKYPCVALFSTITINEINM